MNNQTKKKTKTKDEQQKNHHQYEFCEVCRLNHNQGRRHVYFPTHKSSLSAFLTRFHTKLSDVRFFLNNPIPLLPDHAHQNRRLWCVFCTRDLLELDNSPFACGNAIEHLASGEHWKRVKGFMWKHGGGMDRVDAFGVSEADFAKWEKKCKSLKAEAAKVESVGQAVGPVNNIHTEMNAHSVYSFQNDNVGSVNSNCINGVLPLQSYTNERVQISSSVSSSISAAGPSVQHMPGGGPVEVVNCMKYSSGCLDNRHSFSSTVSVLPHDRLSNGSGHSAIDIANGANSSQGLLNLTRISAASQGAIEGNVHTGAPPPWLSGNEGNGIDIMHKPKHSDFVTKSRKAPKLNPKRIGAAWAERRKLELEMEKRGELVAKDVDANWLPNFGGVWHSGTRKVSRKEFQMENTSLLKSDSHSEKPVPLQPYISKRMRRDSNE